MTDILAPLILITLYAIFHELRSMNKREANFAEEMRDRFIKLDAEKESAAAAAHSNGRIGE